MHKVTALSNKLGLKLLGIQDKKNGILTMCITYIKMFAYYLNEMPFFSNVKFKIASVIHRNMYQEKMSSN